MRLSRVAIGYALLASAVACDDERSRSATAADDTRGADLHLDATTLDGAPATSDAGDHPSDTAVPRDADRRAIGGGASPDAHPEPGLLDDSGARIPRGEGVRVTDQPEKPFDFRLASSGSEVGIVWHGGVDRFGRVIFFVRLGRDASPIGPSVRLSGPAMALGADIGWNGTEWAAAWTELSTPGAASKLWFQRIAADGTLIGRPALLNETGPNGQIRVGYHPVSGWYVATFGRLPVYFWRMSPDGTALPPTVTPIDISGFGVGNIVDAAAQADGSLAAIGQESAGIMGFRAEIDGSIHDARRYHTSNECTVVSTNDTGYYVVSTSFDYDAVVLRGVDMAESTVLFDWDRYDHPSAHCYGTDYAGGRGTVAWSVVPHDGADFDRLALTSITFPADPTDPPIRSSEPRELLTTATVLPEVSPGVAMLGADRAVVVWVDARWLPYRELYAMSVSLE